jgi:hypothetical protein
MSKLKKILGLAVIFMVIFTFNINVLALTPTYVPSSNPTYKDIGSGLKYANVIAKSSSEKSSTLVAQNINLLLKEGNNKQVKIVPWAGFDGTSSYPYRWTGMNVVDLAKDFEANNPGYKVLAGVNSVFFSMPGATASDSDFVPIDALGIDGNVYKTNTVTKVLGFDRDGNHEAGLSTSQKQLRLTIYDNNSNIIDEIVINKINALPSTNETAVLFDNLTTTVTTSSGAIYQIANPDVIKINGTEYYGLGTISAKPESLTFTNAKKFFSIVTKNAQLISALSVGTKVRVQYHFTNELGEYPHVQGYHGQILKNGEVPSDYSQIGTTSDPSLYSSRHPRTTIGFKEDGSILVATVDGRNEADGKYGMNLQELGYMMKYYGCVDAYNFDGGGSTTMIIRDESVTNKFKIINDISETSPRRVVAGVFFVVNEAGYVDASLKSIYKDSAIIDVNYIPSTGVLKNITAICNNIEYLVTNNQVTIPYTKKVNYVNFKITYTINGTDKVYYEKSPLTFNGLKFAPTISNVTVSDITGSTAKINFNITDNDGALTKTSVYINDYEYVGNSSTVNLYNLKGNTTYKGKVKVEYNNGQETYSFYTEEFSFTTLKRLPNENDVTTSYEQVANKNSMLINVQINDSSSLINKIYVLFNEQKLEVVNNQVILDNITYGKTYRYGIGYDYYDNDQLVYVELDYIERFSLTTDYPSTPTSSVDSSTPSSSDSSTPSVGGGGCTPFKYANQDNSLSLMIVLLIGIGIVKKIIF